MSSNQPRMPPPPPGIVVARAVQTIPTVPSLPVTAMTDREVIETVNDHALRIGIADTNRDLDTPPALRSFETLLNKPTRKRRRPRAGGDGNDDQGGEREDSLADSVSVDLAPFESKTEDAGDEDNSSYSLSVGGGGGSRNDSEPRYSSTMAAFEGPSQTGAAYDNEELMLQKLTADNLERLKELWSFPDFNGPTGPSADRNRTVLKSMIQADAFHQNLNAVMKVVYVISDPTTGRRQKQLKPRSRRENLNLLRCLVQWMYQDLFACYDTQLSSCALAPSDVQRVIDGFVKRLFPSLGDEVDMTIVSSLSQTYLFVLDLVRIYYSTVHGEMNLRDPFMAKIGIMVRMIEKAATVVHSTIEMTGYCLALKSQNPSASSLGSAADYIARRHELCFMEWSNVRDMSVPAATRQYVYNRIIKFLVDNPHYYNQRNAVNEVYPVRRLDVRVVTSSDWKPLRILPPSNSIALGSQKHVNGVLFRVSKEGLTADERKAGCMIQVRRLNIPVPIKSVSNSEEDLKNGKQGRSRRPRFDIDHFLTSIANETSSFTHGGTTIYNSPVQTFLVSKGFASLIKTFKANDVPGVWMDINHDSRTDVYPSVAFRDCVVEFCYHGLNLRGYFDKRSSNLFNTICETFHDINFRQLVATRYLTHPDGFSAASPAFLYYNGNQFPLYDTVASANNEPKSFQHEYMRFNKYLMALSLRYEELYVMDPALLNAPKGAKHAHAANPLDGYNTQLAYTLYTRNNESLNRPRANGDRLPREFRKVADTHSAEFIKTMRLHVNDVDRPKSIADHPVVFPILPMTDLESYSPQFWEKLFTWCHLDKIVWFAMNSIMLERYFPFTYYTLLHNAHRITFGNFERVMRVYGVRSKVDLACTLDIMRTEQRRPHQIVFERLLATVNEWTYDACEFENPLSALATQYASRLQTYNNEYDFMSVEDASIDEIIRYQLRVNPMKGDSASNPTLVNSAPYSTQIPKPRRQAIPEKDKPYELLGVSDYVLCRTDREHDEVLRYFIRSLGRYFFPSRRDNCHEFVYLRGRSGVGKSVILSMFKKLFSTRIGWGGDGQSGQFAGSDMMNENTMLVIVPETTERFAEAMGSQFKSLVSQESTTLSRKHMSSHTYEDGMRFFLAGNDPVPFDKLCHNKEELLRRVDLVHFFIQVFTYIRKDYESAADRNLDLILQKWTLAYLSWMKLYDMAKRPDYASLRPHYYNRVAEEDAKKTNDLFDFLHHPAYIYEAPMVSGSGNSSGIPAALLRKRNSGVPVPLLDAFGGGGGGGGRGGRSDASSCFVPLTVLFDVYRHFLGKRYGWREVGKRSQGGVAEFQKQLASSEELKVRIEVRDHATYYAYTKDYPFFKKIVDMAIRSNKIYAAEDTPREFTLGSCVHGIDVVPDVFAEMAAEHKERPQDTNYDMLTADVIRYYQSYLLTPQAVPDVPRRFGGGAEDQGARMLNVVAFTLCNGLKYHDNYNEGQRIAAYQDIVSVSRVLKEANTKYQLENADQEFDDGQRLDLDIVVPEDERKASAGSQPPPHKRAATQSNSVVSLRSITAAVNGSDDEGGADGGDPHEDEQKMAADAEDAEDAEDANDAEDAADQDEKEDEKEEKYAAQFAVARVSPEIVCRDYIKAIQEFNRVADWFEAFALRRKYVTQSSDDAYLDTENRAKQHFDLLDAERVLDERVPHRHEPNGQRAAERMQRLVDLANSRSIVEARLGDILRDATDLLARIKQAHFDVVTNHAGGPLHGVSRKVAIFMHPFARSLWANTDPVLNDDSGRVSQADKDARTHDFDYGWSSDADDQIEAFQGSLLYHELTRRTRTRLGVMHVPIVKNRVQRRVIASE